MPHWIIKAALQRGISWLPFSHKCNALFQKYGTRSLDLTDNQFGHRLGLCGEYLAAFDRHYAGPKQGFSAMEIGTGWYPVVPIGLYLRGADTVWCYDIAQHVSTDHIMRTIDRFRKFAEDGTLKDKLPGVMPDRLEKLWGMRSSPPSSDPVKLLQSIGIRLIVGDAGRSGLPENSVDLFVSTGVLEYIPEPVLHAICAEFRRVGNPGFVAVHYLNLVDQYHYFDSTISPLNFLRFTERQWKWFNSPLTWLNRLRISDYRKMFAGAGMTVLSENNTLGEPADLDRVPLAPEFQAYAREDLLVHLSVVVTRGP